MGKISRFISMSCCEMRHVTTIGSVVIIIVSLICASLVGYHSGQKTRGLKQEPVTSSPQWCMACDLLANKSNSHLMEKLNRVTMDNVNKCCANNSEQASALVEMLMSSKDDNPEPLKTFDAGNFSLSKASAHKQLIVSTFQSLDEPVFHEGENVRLEFEAYPENPFGEHARNIEVKKFALVVLQEGMYFVYSSIFFKPFTARQCKDLGRQTWEHKIILTRNNDKEHSGTILNTTYTCCDDCKRHKETSYAGGMFHLKENDHLHVEVSSDGVVSFRKDGSYLGLFMMP